MRVRKPDCDEENLGLSEDQLGELSGFTGRAFAALAHLREAWLVADENNAQAIEVALQALLHGHSFADNHDLVRAVLTHGMGTDVRAEMLKVIG